MNLVHSMVAAFAVMAMSSAPAFADINVSGTGTISVEPDTAYITVGVVTEDKDPQVALSQNTVKMKKLFASLKDLGLEDKEIQTTNFSLLPRYKYVKNSEPVFLGFRVTNTVRLTVCDLAQLGTVITTSITEAGTNRVGGISFDIKDRTALLQKARVAAVQDALSKADVLATTAGSSVGKLKSISEHSSSRIVVPRYNRSVSMAEADSAPVSGGSLDVIVRVNVVFEVGE